MTAKPLSALGLKGPGDPSISGLSVDSRKVEKGHLFAALPGTKVHGGEFAQYAIRMGAAAVLTDEEGARIIDETVPGHDTVILIDANPRLALARAAARFHAAQPETIVAVTGTNGKTSVSSFTRQIWEALGFEAVNFGTTGVEGAVAAPLTHTTPEPVTLHALLADLDAKGVTHAAMEASSHGLAQHRLDGVQLRAGAFTNITRDHLDYHADAEEYFQAKLGLFTRVLPHDGVAVINIDDPRGQEVVDAASARGLRVLTVGEAETADLRILSARFDPAGQDVRFAYESEVYQCRLTLIGGFQAHNAALAAGLVIGCGADPAQVFRVLPQLETVRGRMELVAKRDNGATIFVDYAHTPDALTTALRALRPHVPGRIVVVFGAGGDRDTGKRPLMGEAATADADVVIVTDDNPRTEDPATIRAAIMEAAPEATEVGDRAEAILAGVDALKPGDALLIAGKGHETGQIVGTDVLHFDDAEMASVAVRALEEKGV
ncbi:UDP-N-acetylmuramoyl-L-alanyl-D-glutamate--2,6-diaminopimelate ligase [Paracoccaceae bacterium GXU_MW_L88]